MPMSRGSNSDAMHHPNQYASMSSFDDYHIRPAYLGEDVADLGGLILAHMAWLAQTAGQTLADRDGLTPEQRFLRGYAQWPAKTTVLNLRLPQRQTPIRRVAIGQWLVINMPIPAGLYLQGGGCRWLR